MFLWSQGYCFLSRRTWCKYTFIKQQWKPALVFTLLQASFRSEHFVRQEQNGQRLTPLLYACKTCEFEIVEYFIDLPGCTKEQRIDALELLGATIANDPNAYDIEKAFSFMKRGMEEGYEDPSCPLLEKKMEPLEAYQNRTESETLEELSLLEGNDYAIQMVGLLIRERILETDNTLLRNPIRQRGRVLAEFFLSRKRGLSAMDVNTRDVREF